MYKFDVSRHTRIILAPKLMRTILRYPMQLRLARLVPARPRTPRRHGGPLSPPLPVVAIRRRAPTSVPITVHLSLSSTPSALVTHAIARVANAVLRAPVASQAVAIAACGACGEVRPASAAAAAAAAAAAGNGGGRGGGGVAVRRRRRRRRGLEAGGAGRGTRIRSSGTGRIGDSDGGRNEKTLRQTLSPAKIEDPGAVSRGLITSYLKAITVTVSYLKAITVTVSYLKAITVTVSYLKAITVTGSYLKAITVTVSYLKAITVTVSYLKAITVTGNRCYRQSLLPAITVIAVV
jgi:hypothetical protein